MMNSNHMLLELEYKPLMQNTNITLIRSQARNPRLRECLFNSVYDIQLC